MEDITDTDYIHAMRGCKYLKKKIGEYHDLYLQNNTSLLADVFENFKKVSLKLLAMLIQELKEILDPPKFLSAPGLA